MAELATLDIPAGAVVLRTATPEDLPALVRLLADDELGVHRESLDAAALPEYRAAFDEITADPAHLLVVAVIDRRIVGTLQFSVIPGLARRGARRAQIEGVRVDEERRDAHRLYRRLGFQASHEGMKLQLIE